MFSQAECDFSVNFAPTVTIQNCPPQDINTNNITFNWVGTDPENDPIQFQTQVDAGGWSGWGNGTSLPLLGLASGSHVFRVRVKDSFGGINQAQCNFAVNFAPTISITNKPSQDVNTTWSSFTWTASDDRDSPLTMQYNVCKDGIWTGWQTGISNYNWTSLPSGARNIVVEVRDNGNPQLTAQDSCDFTVNYKPSVSFNNCPIGIWPSSDLIITWTGVDDNTPPAGMSYCWKLDGGAWSPWQLGLMQTDLTGLTNAMHTIMVRCRDTGTPPLECDTAPDTCASCTFTVDTNCSFPPPDVNNFAATKALGTLNNREVKLSWTAIPTCVDFYDIDRLNYVAGTWTWQPLTSVAQPLNSYTDTDARYSGPADPISYRLKARNAAGSSTDYSTDTGYPKLRNVNQFFWCWAQDSSGTNASTTWARAAADYADCDTFWNGYGLNEINQNGGNFTYITEPQYESLA